MATEEKVRPDLRFWLDEWVTKYRDDVSEARRKADRTRIDRYIIPHLGRRSVSNLGHEDIEGWIDTLREEGVGDSTIHASLLALRGSLSHAMDRGLLRQNPAHGVSVSGLQVIRRPEPQEILSEAQLQALIKAADPWYRSLILFAARTGAKWEEAIGLRIQDVYLDQGMVTVGRLKASEQGGHITYSEGRPKDSRLIQMTDDLISELGAYVEGTDQWRSDNWPFVFMTKRDHRHPLRPNFNTFVLKPALEDAGLDPDLITYHSLRHTAAVRMIKEGLPVEKISQALGHRSVVTTRRIYTDFLRAQASKASRAQ